MIIKRINALMLAVMISTVLFCDESAFAASKYKPFVPTDPIMPISQIKPGMKGICRTVVRGTKVSTFPIEVIDILPQQSAPRNLIMIRVSGSVIQETGGIASGMSGSPVYINGKLIGAIGYGWNFSRHDMGLVTPIEDMIEIWNNPEILPTFDLPPIIPEKPLSDDKKPNSAPVSGDRKKEGAEQEPAKVDSGVSREVPSFVELSELSEYIFVSGLSSRMADRMGEALGKKVAPFGGGASGRSKTVRYNAKGFPGMAIGAALTWGDVEMSAIGTLSAVDADGRFVAFAHPFAELGPTAAALTEADIARVVPSVSSPFKVGSTGDIIGIVTQDRPQGIGGRIGQFAPAASCTINFKDIDSDRVYKRHFQMVQDKYLISKLAGTAIVGCVEELWGRTGGGSARVVAKFGGSVLPDGWSRRNVFISDKDVTAEMLEEFNLLTQVFAVNQFQEIKPLGIEIDVELTQEPRVLYIENVDVPKGPFFPGQTVSFDITLRPWRKAPFVREYSLVIPEKVSGISEILVRGGGIREESAEYLEAGWRSISSLPILLRELDAKESNDQIVIELRGEEALEKQIERARRGDPDDLMNDKLLSEIRAEKIKEGSMRIVRTNYYVDGVISKLIKVGDGAGASDLEEYYEEEEKAEDEREREEEGEREEDDTPDDATPGGDEDGGEQP